ncbi:gram-negative porin family protein [Paraburkholderia xenovorans LB400]|uniref:Outer membrane porin, OmpC family n=1 Tax=Paraburkholderia xenovorans (strain LB400) TaxID=266265 RepID=Q13I27_PARXL|nr:porin [Paraburkholderia xenovorans]ABE36262.1 outer membrane porin, OmpC family [Paraburkholderia xenovorans LB400]AIP34190.1 gram-negative porin family protein [Paraburkholderia xenovorans LB400]
MKAKYLALVAPIVLSSHAMAQSSVTLYGVIDEAIRYQSNPGGTGTRGASVGMSEGAISGNRFGLRGDEDLGGGTHAIFDLQGGFNAATGKIDQQGQLFGRYAWMGLANQKFGTLKVGRQYGSAFSFDAFTFDAIGGGNITATDWELFLVGCRYDNTVDYTNQLGPLSLNLQHSFGGQPGNTSIGSTTSGALYYGFGGGKLGIFGQQSKDAASHKLVVGQAGANYGFGKTSLYAYYIYTKRDAGFAIGAAGTSAALANTNIMNNATTAYGAQTVNRIDQFIRLGAAYQPLPDWRFTISYAYDHARNVAPGRNGQLQTLYGIADYILSKHTDLYLEVDDSRISGASVNDPNSPLGTAPGVRQVLGASLSLRTTF